MVTLEKIDQLKSRVNVSYNDAKEALENTEGDILEAIIYLEENGKINTNEEKQESSSKSGCKVVDWCKNLLKKGNSNFLVISKKETTVLRISLTIAAILVIAAPYVSIPAFILAFFTGYSIRFSGSDIEKTKANDAVNKASKTAEDIKSQFAQ